MSVSLEAMGPQRKNTPSESEWERNRSDYQRLPRNVDPRIES